VLVDGSALAGMTRNQRARLRRRLIGYVFQDFNLLAGLTAVENVALPLELDGVGRHAARVHHRGGQHPAQAPPAQEQQAARHRLTQATAEATAGKP
jgi:predicted ABC-type transport system involved in lysophospholipase L1 biosynthesis ATPase subunit